MVEIKAFNRVDFPVASMNRLPYENIGAINSIAAPQGIYNDVIPYSAMFDHASVTRLTRTYNVAATVDAQIATFSVWLKRTALNTLQIIVGGKTNDENKAWLGFTTGNNFEMAHKRNNVWQCLLITAATFADCAGWYHIHYIYDSDQGTQTNRITLTINGVDYDAADSNLWSTYTLPGSGEACRLLEDNEPHWVSGYPDNGSYFNGYMGDVYCLEGVAVPYTNFGEFKNGIWVPKDYVVGTNSEGELSYKLDFSDSSNLGDDVSVNAHDFTVDNMGTDHQVPDSPEHNYCTIDWNNKHYNTSVLIREGGLNFLYAGSSWVTSCATFLMKTGKWYWEIDIGSDAFYSTVGIIPQGETSGDLNIAIDNLPGSTALGYGFRTYDASNYAKLNSNSYTNDTNLDAPAASDIITVAFDADAGKIWFGLYNAGSGHVWGNFGGGVGDPATGTNAAFDSIDATLYDYVASIAVHSNATSIHNFGQSAFSGTQPTGFLSLTFSNLPEPLMIEPTSKAMNVVLWDGDNGATKSITGVGFQPDMVIIKARSGATTNYVLTDSVRGVDLGLAINGNIVETDQATTGYLESFDSDGFTLNYGGGTPTYTHRTGYTYVGWCWKKSAAYGFDIQTYTGDGIAGRTVSHDLGVIPQMIITKNRTVGGTEWPIYHHEGPNKTNPEDYRGLWDEDGVWTDSDLFWNDTKPTSSVFTVGAHDNVNDSGIGMVAYRWTSIPGYSKVFSYVGNGNVAGPYVYLGFRPAFIMFKNAQGTNSW